MIREEIRNAKYCILVNEALDEDNKEQMAIVLRFVDGEGYVRERFFDIVEVVDTKALTLKSEICTWSVTNIAHSLSYSHTHYKINSTFS